MGSDLVKPASIRKQMIKELENIPEDKLQLLLELIRSSKSDLSDLLLLISSSSS